MSKSKVNIRTIIKKIGIIFAVLLILSLLLLLVLRFIYPSVLRANHKIESPGIDLMETVEIGGINQALYFRGKNLDNPVILYVHGGPGMPMMPLLHGFQYEWESDFTIVHWDQRNAGKTFYLSDPEIILETLTIDTVLADAHEVTQYIKKKLNKEKIIILGHSWGSVLGTMLVREYPQDYSAYIGVGQIVNMKENTPVGYHAALEFAISKGNKRDIAALEKLDPELGENFLGIRKYLNKYNMAEDYSFRLIMLAVTSPHYKFNELMYYLNVNTFHYSEPLFNFLDDFNMRDNGANYEIPVFYIMGERDYQTPYPLAKSFFEEISAPHKEFFSVPNASHLTMLDNKDEFNRILIEVIKPLLTSD